MISLPYFFAKFSYFFFSRNFCISFLTTNFFVTQNKAKFREKKRKKAKTFVFFANKQNEKMKNFRRFTTVYSKNFCVFGVFVEHRDMCV